MMGYDEIDRHELYAFVGSLPREQRFAIRNMVDRMNDIINEAPSNGHVALGILAMELTGLSITTVRPTGKGH